MSALPEHQEGSPAERLTAAERALAEALAERNRLWAALNQERVDRRELEHLRHQLDVVRGSRVWRLAGRYQRVKQLVRSGLRRLRAS